jgi:hypothetical protein
MNGRRRFLLLLATAGIALAASIGPAPRAALEHAAAHMLPAHQRADRERIAAAVRLYNRYSALFYNTGGGIEGLDEIPAGHLLKRRLFKDITMLKRDGLVMVFDKDTEELHGISILSPSAAIAETAETWFVSLQDYTTRKPLFSLKASRIRARYFLHREQRGWIVEDVSVYPASEQLPPLDADEVRRRT